MSIASSIAHAFDRSTLGGFVRSPFGARNVASFIPPTGCYKLNWMSGNTLICDSIYSQLYISLIGPIPSIDQRMVATGFPLIYDLPSNTWRNGYTEHGQTIPVFGQDLTTQLDYVGGQIVLHYQIGGGPTITVPASGQGCLGCATSLQFDGLVVGGQTANALIANQCCSLNGPCGEWPNLLYLNVCGPNQFIGLLTGYTPVLLTKVGPGHWMGANGGYAVDVNCSGTSTIIYGGNTYILGGNSLCSPGWEAFYGVFAGPPNTPSSWVFGTIDVNALTSQPCCPWGLPDTVHATISSTFWYPNGPITTTLTRGGGGFGAYYPGTWIGGIPAAGGPGEPGQVSLRWPGAYPVYGRGYTFYYNNLLSQTDLGLSFSSCSPLDMVFGVPGGRGIAVEVTV